MEKKYYIADNGKQQGPFTAEELRDYGITADSRIYARGWTEFRNASEVPELADYLTSSPKTSTEPQSVASGNAESVVIGAPASSDGSSAAETPQSEKELLMRILSHLDELQRENRQLKEEMAEMRSGTPSQQTPPPPGASQVKGTVAPPPFNPAGEGAVPPAPPVADASAVEEWNKEWDNTINPTTPARKKGGSYGCLVAIVIITILFIIGCFIYSLSGNNSSDYGGVESAATYIEDEYAPAVEEAAPTEAAAEDYYYDSPK